MLEHVERFEQGIQQSAQGVARADGPGGDAVDAGVEVIQPDVDSLQSLVADDFLGDGLQIIVESDHMVAVPAHATADVEQQLVKIKQHGRDFVCDCFRWMKVTRVKCQQNFAAQRIRGVEFHRADHVTFRANAKEFWLHCIEVVARIDFFSEDRIEGFEKQVAGRATVGG